jgi:hypothetical protein
VHEAKYFIASALKRNVKVRHKSTALTAKAYDFFCKQVGLYAANPVSLYSFYVVERTDEINELLSSSSPKIANVNARQYNFLASLPYYVFCLFDKRGDTPISASPPGKMNCAVSTEIIASILYF